MMIYLPCSPTPLSLSSHQPPIPRWPPQIKVPLKTSTLKTTQVLLYLPATSTSVILYSTATDNPSKLKSQISEVPSIISLSASTAIPTMSPHWVSPVASAISTSFTNAKVKCYVRLQCQLHWWTSSGICLGASSPWYTRQSVWTSTGCLRLWTPFWQVIQISYRFRQTCLSHHARRSFQLRLFAVLMQRLKESGVCTMGMEDMEELDGCP
jgi:hypothetical protein